MNLRKDDQYVHIRVAGLEDVPFGKFSVEDDGDQRVAERCLELVANALYARANGGGQV